MPPFREPGIHVRRLIDPAELRELARLGLPMVATQFCIMAMGFLDTAMAGNYASVDLAGVALGGNVLWPLFMLMSGLNMALTPMSAQLRGEGKVTAIGPLTRQGLWVALLASGVTVLVLLNASMVFALFDVDAEAARIGERYLEAAAWGIPGVMLYVTLRYTCEGLGRTLPPMVIAASALVINGILNYIFIYGKLGMPAMGGEGCGWATALTMWIELGLILLLLRCHWFRETGILDRFDGLDAARIASLVRVGLPIGLTVFLEMAVFSVLGFLVGSLGVAALAAHSIAGNINWGTYVIPLSIGSAASIRVGYCVGRRVLDDARVVARTATVLAFVYALGASALLLAIRGWIPTVYTGDGEVVRITATLLVIVAVYQVVDCTQATMVGVLRGYKDTRMPMVYSFAGLWLIALPLAAALGFGWFGRAWDVFGFWFGMAIGLTVVCMFIGRRLWQTSRNDARVLEFAAI